MKLSIIVPVYNMASHEKLTFCMDSLLSQTLEACDFEIIPVDDCSTDDSPAILKKYESLYPDLVKPIYSPVNRKQGGAKNLGLSKACGEWIGFVDSDDWVHPSMYQKLLAKAEATGADVVGCQYCITHEHSFLPGQKVMIHSADQCNLPPAEHCKSFIRKPGSMVVKIYKRDVILQNNLSFPENTFYEDNQAGPLWMLSFSHFELVDEPLYYYYQHEASTVHTISMDRLHNRMDMATGLIDAAKERNIYEDFVSEWEASFTRIYYVNTLFSYMQSTTFPRFDFLRELQQGMLHYFPDFQNNKDFCREYDKEQQKMIRLHMKNIYLYAAYDKALRIYRRIRYGQK